MTTPKHNNPSPAGNQIYNFGKLSLGHHYEFVKSVPQSIEEDFKRNNANSLYNVYGHTLTKNLCPRVMKFTILVESSWSS